MAVRVGRDVLDAMSRTRVGTTRTLLAVAFALCFSAVPGQSAATMDLPSASSWRPDGLFLQSGWGKRVQATVFGAKWDWQWEQEFAGGRASGYWEASFGRWHAEAGASPAGSAWVTQLGLTPVLRWRPGTIGDEWYVELGIGANLVTPIYRRHERRFSTAFNFGDHVAVGWRFGSGRQHEVALRLQHFSNAGIQHPNPGENFLQLRYGWRY